MLDRADQALAIRRQCMLLGITLFTVYPPPRSAIDNDLAPDTADRRAVHRLANPRLVANDRNAEVGASG
jgi:hypothetical protein